MNNKEYKAPKATEDQGVVINKEYFFRDSRLIKEIFAANKKWEELSDKDRKEFGEKMREFYKTARENRKYGENYEL